MNPPPQFSPAHERRLLYTLAGVNFTHILDFMIVMPLGASLMRVFAITPTQFSVIVASYGVAAAVSGFAAGFVLDRIERKRALLVLYTGFLLATLGCALATSYAMLVAARIAAGACGGVAGSVIVAMVGDVVPPERRGRAMSTVTMAFPLASVLGIPVGVWLAGTIEWHAPFFLICALGAGILLHARRVLPALPGHPGGVDPLRQMREIVTHRVHVRCFLLSAALVLAGGSMIPFMAPAMVANVGLDESTQLPLVYFLGGACTFFTMPWFGRMSDRHDKLHVLAGATVCVIIVAQALARLGPGPVWYPLAVSTLFFVTMSGRFAPAMAMISNAVESRYRAGVMSVNSAVQQAAGGAANFTAGLLITRDAAQHLVGYPRVAWVATFFFVLTVVLAAYLRSAAPHAARNPAPAAAP